MKMKLNDFEDFRTIDVKNYVGLIETMPDDLARGFETDLSELLEEVTIRQVVLVGMGTAREANELLAAFVAKVCEVPVMVVSDYALPKVAMQAGSLVVMSGMEKHEVFEDWLEQAGTGEGMTVAICGEAEMDVDVWVDYDFDGPERASLGFLFGVLLGVFVRLGLVMDVGTGVDETVAMMKTMWTQNMPAVPAARNAAKRYAGQLVERYTTIFGVGFLAAVARRWKNQINLNAKAPACVEQVPDSSFNTFAGVMFSEKVFATNLCLFLRAEGNGERDLVHEELNRMGMLAEGVGVDFVNGKGASRLAQMWSLIVLGDLISYYLAMIYEVDPWATPAIEELWEDLAME